MNLLGIRMGTQSEGKGRKSNSFEKEGELVQGPVLAMVMVDLVLSTNWAWAEVGALGPGGSNCQ